MLPSDKAILFDILTKRERGEKLTDVEEQIEYSLYYLHPRESRAVEKEVKNKEE